MDHNLRQPILEVLSKTKIKIISGGSLIRFVFLSLICLSIVFCFGFAFFVGFGLAACLVFSIPFTLLYSFIMYLQFKIPRFYVFDIKEKMLTRYPVFGLPKTLPFEAETLEVELVRNPETADALILNIDFGGVKSIVATQISNNLTKANYAFIIELIMESIKCQSVYSAYKDAYISASGKNHLFQDAFVDLYSPSDLKRTGDFISKIILYASTIVMSFFGIVIIAAVIRVIFW